MTKYLKTIDDKCKGCKVCEQSCSALYFKENNPVKSRIVVDELSSGFHLTACNQCGECIAECPVVALTTNKSGVVMLSNKLCIGCLACAAVCPTHAMRPVPAQLSPIKCIACGACAKTCPEGALEIIEEVN